jgi:glycine/D-amino acid oxidase-like deaminating enzyme
MNQLAKEKVSYLIIGQGLVGTWVSYYLKQRSISFKIINDPATPSASSVASGVINPVTGRRIVQTWMIDELLPFAIDAYTQIGALIGETIIQHAPVITIHASEQMKESFEFRLTHDNVYLAENKVEDWIEYFKIPFGTGQINECYWLDLNTLLQKWNTKLISNNHLINEKFEMDNLQILENGVQWKNIIADHIIFCDGNNSMQNEYFNCLPFAPNKGEALIVRIPGLPKNHIYKNNVSIVPWKEDLFWVGSNYEWTFENDLPSPNFKEKMMAALDSLLSIPYTIVDHLAGIRPANTQRRPFVGTHPYLPQLAICNGMGTKGCSLAPYFSKQLISHLENGDAIHAEADVLRFKEKFIKIK